MVESKKGLAKATTGVLFPVTFRRGHTHGGVFYKAGDVYLECTRREYEKLLKRDVIKAVDGVLVT